MGFMAERTRKARSANDNGRPDEQFPFGANAPDGAAQAGAAPTGTDAPTDGLDAEAEALDTPNPAPRSGWLEDYGLDQDFDEEVAAPGKPKIIKVEKPTKTRIFRTHPDRKMWIRMPLLALKEENETYLIRRGLRKHLPPSIRQLLGDFALVPCVSEGKTPFLWPIRMADEDGKWNVWHSSAWQIAEEAMATWVRLYANRDAGYYSSECDTRPAEEQPEPAWPELSKDEWFEIAFGNHRVNDLDHPVMRRLLLKTPK
jgi:hypothetical protein